MSAFCSVPLVQDAVRDLSSHHQAFFNLMPWWHHRGQNWRVTEDNYYFVLYFSSMSCILPSTSHFSRFHKSILIFLLSKPSNVFLSHIHGGQPTQITSHWHRTSPSSRTLSIGEGALLRGHGQKWRTLNRSHGSVWEGWRETRETWPLDKNKLVVTWRQQTELPRQRPLLMSDALKSLGTTIKLLAIFIRRWTSLLLMGLLLNHVSAKSYIYMYIYNVCTLSNDCSRAC